MRDAGVLRHKAEGEKAKHWSLIAGSHAHLFPVKKASLVNVGAFLLKVRFIPGTHPSLTFENEVLCLFMLS